MVDINKNSRPRQLWLLMTPSWISGFISFFIAILTSITAVVLTYQKGLLSQDIFAAHSVILDLHSNYQTAAVSISRYQIIGNGVLLLFWMGVGLIVYIFIANLFKGIRASVHLEEELHFMNSKPLSVIKETFLHLIVRLLAIVGWLVLVDLFFHIILPYDLASARVMTRNFDVVNLARLIAVTFVVIVDLCLQASCLRLLLLRERIFGVVY